MSDPKIKYIKKHVQIKLKINNTVGKKTFSMIFVYTKILE